MFVVYYDEDVFNYLINFTQDFSVVDGSGYNIVHRIAFSYHDDVVCSRLLMKLSEKTNVESFINNKDHHFGQTPLHVAASNNRHRLIETIVKLGGDVNIKDKYNRLPDEQDECDDETKRIIQRLRRQW